MKRAIVTLAVCFALIGITHAQGNQQAPAKYITPRNITNARLAQQVYDACNSSRVHPNVTEGQACNQLQAQYNMEFLCAGYNALPSNQCWVEAK